MAELGAITTLPSTKQAVAFARLAETLGFSRVGLADTAPRLYHAVYPAVTACLLGTERLSVSTYVTNPVTRHWSVHAASARGLEELAPGRFVLGMATGDGAVHSVGLKPAKLADMEAYVHEMKALMPESARIHMVFSGTKGVEVGGRLASELTIGTGLDAGALRELARRARAARAEAGITAPLKIWGLAPTHLAETEDEVPALRRHVRGLANGSSRFAFDFTFDGKNVPEEFQPILREGLGRYDFVYHGKAGDHPNAHLFDDHPEVQDYLLDRMQLIGTPRRCAERLGRLIEDAGLDGVWIPIVPTPGDPPSAQLMQLCTAAEAFGHLAGSSG